ncbi:MAG: condensation domain-containing protein [Actinoplanes sp.]
MADPVRDGIAVEWVTTVPLAEVRAALAGVADRHEVLRAAPIELSETASGVRITWPASAVDLGCLPLLARELTAALAGRLEKEPAPEYSLLSAWLDELRDSPDAAPGLAYWRRVTTREHYQDWTVTAAGPRHRVPVEVSTTTLDRLRDQHGDLRERLLTGWARQINAAHGTPRCVVGVYLDGRTEPDVQDLLGPLGHYVPVWLGDHPHQLASAAAHLDTHRPAAGARFRYTYDHTRLDTAEPITVTHTPPGALALSVLELPHATTLTITGDRIAAERHAHDLAAVLRELAAEQPLSPAQRLVLAAFQEVLPPEVRPALDDSLFTLGGTSMDAARLCARLSTATGASIPVARFMAAPTVDGVARLLPDHRPEPAGPVERRHTPVAAPMAPEQVALWLNERRRRGGDASQLCLISWWIRGPLSDEALTAALADLHRRHQLLSSRYVLGSDPLVVPDPAIAPPELFRLPACATADEAVHAVRQRLGRPLDIAAGEVWQAGVTRTGDAELLGIAVNHVAFDAPSEAVLARDLATAYAARLAGRAPVFATTPAGWAQVREALAQQSAPTALAAQEAYWRDALAGLSPLRLPVGDTGGDLLGVADRELTEQTLAPWLASARRLGATPLAAVMAYVGSRLAAMTGQYDFAFGVPVTRRAGAIFDDTVGCLMETVCVRLGFDPDHLEPAGAVASTHAAARAAFAAPDVPLVRVVNLAKPPRSRRHPLFQAMFAMQEAPYGPLALPGGETTFVRMDPPRAVAEIVFEVFPNPGGGHRLHVTYRPEAVRPSFVTALLASL